MIEMTHPQDTAVCTGLHNIHTSWHGQMSLIMRILKTIVHSYCDHDASVLTAGNRCEPAKRQPHSCSGWSAKIYCIYSSACEQHLTEHIDRGEPGGMAQRALTRTNGDHIGCWGRQAACNAQTQCRDSLVDCLILTCLRQCISGSRSLQLA